MSQDTERAQDDILRALWRDKIHVAPRALDLSSASVRNEFEHIFAPAEVIVDQVKGLPLGLLSLWHASERGHVVVDHMPSRYESGRLPWRTGDLYAVALVSVANLVGNTQKARVTILTMLDHLLGSDGGGQRLSDGCGSNDALAETASRFVRIHSLGYGHDQLQVVAPGDYLATTWALYLENPSRLNVIDPLMFRLFRDRLMSPRFWSSLID